MNNFISECAHMRKFSNPHPSDILPSSLTDASHSALQRTAQAEQAAGRMCRFSLNLGLSACKGLSCGGEGWMQGFPSAWGRHRKGKLTFKWPFIWGCTVNTFSCQPPHSSWLHSLPGTAHTPVHKLWLLTHREGDSLLPNRTDILIHILVYIFAGLRSEAPGPKLFFFNLKLLIKILLNCHPKKSCTNLHIHQWRTEVPISPQSHQLWKLFANWVGKKYCFNWH